MSRAYEKVRAFIECHSMLESTSGIVVAVSGGPDSVALLDMLVRLVLGDRGKETDYRESDKVSANSVLYSLSPIPFIHIGHLDHQLRGLESAEDAKFVERLAHSLNLPITIGSINVRAVAQEAGRGIEETARELRYKFLLDTAQAVGCDRIATGHTMSDQAETFLMRLARGAGLRGLGAMRPVGRVPVPDTSINECRSAGEQVCRGAREQGSKAEIEDAPLLPRTSAPLLVRPLLCVTRKEVEQYCRERELEFRTDPTNESAEYARNRVRHDALPALRRINSGVVENIARAAEIIAEAEDAFDYAASVFLDKARVGSAKGTNRSKASIEVEAYSVAKLLAQPAGLRRRVLLEAINQAQRADQLQSGERAQITSAHVASVERLLEEKASGNRAQLPGNLEVWREFDAIVFKSTALPASVEHLADECEVAPERARVEAGGVSVSIERGIAGELLHEVIDRVKREKEQSGRDWMSVALDDTLLPERLVVRPRRQGETALVTGKRRTIKLKNLMIGHKIPTSRRSVWPVIVTLDGRYVWSPGLPPAVEFAASDRSEKLAILRASGF